MYTVLHSFVVKAFYIYLTKLLIVTALFHVFARVVVIIVLKCVQLSTIFVPKFYFSSPYSENFKLHLDCFRIIKDMCMLKFRGVNIELLSGKDVSY